MPTSYAHYGATHPQLGAIAGKITRPLLRRYAAHFGFHTPTSDYARERGASFAEKLQRGERVIVAGIGPAGHNSGVALIEASLADGIRLICNNEEERYSGIRHCTNWPEHSLHAALAMLERRGIAPAQIHAFAARVT
jgi:carbamoyltransferase